MNLAPDLNAQATVAAVEYAECCAMRTLYSQENTVMFPSHPQRLMNTLRDEVQWLRRRTTRELSGKEVSFTQEQTKGE